MAGTFYLHEDEWGMVELLPAENMAGRKEVAQEASRFGEAHSDGAGWTDVYVIPEAEHSIAERQIPLNELRTLVGSWLPEADTVQSGYSSYVETLPHSFAFAGADGAFYGNHEGEMITHLNVLRPADEDEEAIARFAEAIAALGERHRLMLADWWSDSIVDLQDRDAIMRYLQSSAE